MSAISYPDKGIFKFLYERYKEYVMPFSILCISLIVILVVNVSQFQSLQQQKSEAQDYKMKNLILQKNIILLSSLDIASQDSQFGLVSSALPADKDFVAVLQSISSAAAISRVSLGDFLFRVGVITTTQSAQLTKVEAFSITTNVDGSIETVKQFVTQLSKQFPLSSVTSLKQDGLTSQISINFYYKPYGMSKINWEQELRPLSQKEISVLNTLKSWNLSLDTFQNVSQASSSAGVSTGSAAKSL